MPKEEKSIRFGEILPSPMNPFHLEMDKINGSMRFLCSGIKGISEYSDSSIKMKTTGFSIVVSGKRLSVTVLEEKTVEVIGKISEVRFVYGKS